MRRRLDTIDTLVRLARRESRWGGVSEALRLAQLAIIDERDRMRAEQAARDAWLDGPEGEGMPELVLTVAGGRREVADESGP